MLTDTFDTVPETISCPFCQNTIDAVYRTLGSITYRCYNHVNLTIDIDCVYGFNLDKYYFAKVFVSYQKLCLCWNLSNLNEAELSELSDIWKVVGVYPVSLSFTSLSKLYSFFRMYKTFS